MSWIEIFILLFVTLGPIRPSIAFFASTSSTEPDVRRSIAIRAVAVATLVTLIITLLGSGILANWRVDVEALEIAGGIILFLSALQLVLGEERQGTPEGPPPALKLDNAIFPLAVPTIVTPQGIVAVIAVESTFVGTNALLIFIAIIGGVMILNLAFLLFAHRIYASVPPAILKLIVRVLGVLLAGLAVQVVIFGLDGLGLMPNL